MCLSFFLWINSGIALHPHPARKSFYPSLAGLTFTAATSLKRFFFFLSLFISRTLLPKSDCYIFILLCSQRWHSPSPTGGHVWWERFCWSLLKCSWATSSKPQLWSNCTCSCVSVCFQERSWKSCTTKRHVIQQTFPWLVINRLL